MEITYLDLEVIMDTLRGSLDITDNGRLFRFQEKLREECLLKLAKGLAEKQVEINILDE
jgi:hypothetical protein